MKWLFLTLILLNFFVFGITWLAHNNINKAASAQYAVNNHIPTIKMITQAINSPDKAGGHSGFQKKCLLLGPVNSDEESRLITDNFVQSGLSAKRVVQVLKEAPNYWVYLKPFTNKSAALVELKKLQKSHIDSYLITRGDIKNGISLGVFENIDSAKDMLDTRIKQGYKAQMINFPKTKHVYWVSVGKQKGSDLLQRVSAQLNELKIEPERRQILCESLASEIKLP